MVAGLAPPHNGAPAGRVPSPSRLNPAASAFTPSFALPPSPKLPQEATGEQSTPLKPTAEVFSSPESTTSDATPTASSPNLVDQNNTHSNVSDGINAAPPIPQPQTLAPVLIDTLQPPQDPDSPIPSDPADHDPWMLARAHILSPHTRTGTRANSASASEFSFDDLPTKKSFRRAHLAVQFPVSAIALGALAGSLLAWKKGEVRWVELALGATAWLASEALKEAIFQLLTFPSVDKEGYPIKATGLGLPTAVHMVVQELLRLGAILITVALLPDAEGQGGLTTMPLPPSHHSPKGPGIPRTPLPPLDTLFWSALWLALGWASVEVTFASMDFWRRIKLYDDVLEDEADFYDEESSYPTQINNDTSPRHPSHPTSALPSEPFPATSSSALLPRSQQPQSYGTQQRLSTTNTGTVGDKSSRSVVMMEPDAFLSPPLNGVGEEDIDEAEDAAELDILIRRVERMEVEAQMGVPLYEVPVAVVVVWRLDSILLSIFLTLLLSLPRRTTSPSLIAFPLWPTFFAAAGIHVFLSLLWVLRIPRLGLPSLSYATLVTVLGLLFAVLAAWGALE